MNLSDLSAKLSAISEAETPETQTDQRLELEPAMIAGGRKPGLDYKEKQVKGVLDRVTLTLTGKNSEYATKAAKKYNEIKTLTEQLTKMKDLFNLDTKEHMLQYFNAEDEVLTRVIKTASLTMTLSKRTVSSTEHVNMDGFYNELLGLLPELEDQLKALREKYTTISKSEKSPALRVKLPGEKAEMDESINEAIGGFWSKVEELGSRVLNSVRNWGKLYDKKLEEFTELYNAPNPNDDVDESLEHREYADNPLKEDDEMGFYFKKNKRNGKIETAPFRAANKSFLYKNPSNLGAFDLEHQHQNLSDEEKRKLIDIWNSDKNSMWVYSLNDEDLFEAEEIFDDAEEQFKPDLEGMIYETVEVKNTINTAVEELQSLIVFAATEFKDRQLSERFKELFFTAAKIKEDLNYVIFDLREKTEVVTSTPVTEELEDTHENMLAIAKKIIAYANHPNKNSAQEDKLSMMLFYKKRPLKSLSLFSILEALQNMDALQYGMIKEFVEGKK